jgi:hypothetical protein
MCRLRGSSSLPTITALPACRANNSPGWRASGAGRHPEEGRLRLSVLSSSQRGLYAAADHRLEQRILSIKPEHEMRRKIIREWMSLPKDKRQTEEQAKPFAKKAMERIPSSGDPYRQIMGWLLPRIGKA